MGKEVTPFLLKEGLQNTGIIQDCKTHLFVSYFLDSYIKQFQGLLLWKVINAFYFVGSGQQEKSGKMKSYSH